MPFSRLWHSVGFVGTDVSEECVASILKVQRTSVFGTTLTVNIKLFATYCYRFSSLLILSTLKMQARRSSETSVLTRPTRRHIPNDGILHDHRRENSISY
jgi:hypothetical protein